jgi:hypothetical protein
MHRYLCAVGALVCTGTILFAVLALAERSGAGPSNGASQPELRAYQQLKDDEGICQPGGPC